MMTPTQSPGAGYRDDEGTSMGDEEQQDLISPPRPVGGPRQRRNFNEQQGSLGGNQYSDGEYSHVSSYVPRQPLESKTYGGYGPVHNNEDNLPSDWTYICGDVDDKGEGHYYRDDFNDQSWSCTFGTGEENGIWMNTRDQAGTIMAFMVWFLLGYSALTITLLAQTGGIPPFLSMFYVILVCMALACHAKTTFSDPGSVPQSAVPMESQRQLRQNLSMCSQCQTFKPPFSHHCRICNRCISRMDRTFVRLFSHKPFFVKANIFAPSSSLTHFLLFSLDVFLIICWFRSLSVDE